MKGHFWGRINLYYEIMKGFIRKRELYYEKIIRENNILYILHRKGIWWKERFIRKREVYNH